MFIVNRNTICRNVVNLHYAKTKMASSLHEVISYLPLHKALKSREYEIFNVATQDSKFEFNVILSDRDISIVFSGMGTRIYDYSHADEAIEFIKMGVLLGVWQLEEDE